jgi:hypothetical protein
VRCDIDEDADANVAAAALEDVGEKVQYVLVGMIRHPSDRVTWQHTIRRDKGRYEP